MNVTLGIPLLSLNVTIKKASSLSLLHEEKTVIYGIDSILIDCETPTYSFTRNCKQQKFYSSRWFDLGVSGMLSFWFDLYSFPWKIHPFSNVLDTAYLKGVAVIVNPYINAAGVAVRKR